MRVFLIKWAVNIAALFIVIYIAGGVSADGWQSVVVAAFILGLLNASIKPALMLLTLPLNVMSFGLLTLVINGFMLYLTSRIVKGFNILDFWDAFWAAVLFSVVSAFLNFIITPKVSFTYTRFDHPEGKRRKIDDDNVIDVEGKVEK